MLTHSEEAHGEKSQSQITQFLGKLMFPFNRIMPIHGGPLDHHSHTSHVKFLTLATIEFKTIKNIQLNLN